jgi:hypothetical protein
VVDRADGHPVTWTITHSVELTIGQLSYTALSTTVGAGIVGLLFGLLLVRELWRIRTTAADPVRGRVIDVLLAPLLIAFPLIVVARLLTLVS